MIVPPLVFLSIALYVIIADKTDRDEKYKSKLCEKWNRKHSISQRFVIVNLFSVL